MTLKNINNHSTINAMVNEDIYNHLSIENYIDEDIIKNLSNHLAISGAITLAMVNEDIYNHSLLVNSHSKGFTMNEEIYNHCLLPIYTGKLDVNNNEDILKQMLTKITSQFITHVFNFTGMCMEEILTRFGCHCLPALSHEVIQYQLIKNKKINFFIGDIETFIAISLNFQEK